MLQSHVEDDAKVAALIKPSRSAPAPRVSRDEDVRETARVLIESNAKMAPVFEDGELWGVISSDAVLEAVLENLNALTVEDVYSAEPVTIAEDDGIGKAINRLREHGISHPGPERERISHRRRDDPRHRRFRHPRERPDDHRGPSWRQRTDARRPGLRHHEQPVETTSLDATAEEAVETMLELDYGGLMVTPDDDDRIVTGVVTKTDVLRALTFTEEEHMDVQITNISLLDTISRESIVESITEVADKYAEMQVMHAHVRFKEHKEKLRGTPLIHCQIRLRTNKGQVAGTGEGYGAENAFRVALDKLERNVLEVKGVTSDQEYRGQLLRKLNEL